MCLCPCVGTHSHGAHVEVRGRLAGVGFLLCILETERGFSGLATAPLPAELSHWPRTHQRHHYEGCYHPLCLHKRRRQSHLTRVECASLCCVCRKNGRVEHHSLMLGS